MVKIENGFAEVGEGLWLMGRGQPAAFFGNAVRRRRKGWVVRDRSSLELVEVGSRASKAASRVAEPSNGETAERANESTNQRTNGLAKCADSTRPFLTHIPCAAPIFAVSAKVLVAPAGARLDAYLIKMIPMNARTALCVTEFGLDDGRRAAPPSEVKRPNESTNQRINEQTAMSDGSSDSAWVVMATSSRTARVALADGETLSVRPEAVVAWAGKRPTGFCPKISVWDVLLPRVPRALLFTFYGPGVVWIEGARDGSKVQRFNGSTVQRRFYGV